MSSQSWPNLQRSLRGVTVAQVMSRDCPTVPRLLTLSQLVETRVLFGAQRCFFVADNGHLRGLLTLRDIVAIPRPQWRTVTTGEAVVPFERLARVVPHTELLAALRTMDGANVAQVPVIEEDEIVGILRGSRCCTTFGCGASWECDQ